jgi:hypothetical protein
MIKEIGPVRDMSQMTMTTPDFLIIVVILHWVAKGDGFRA